MADRDRHGDLVGEGLQAKLPGAQFMAVAAAAVGTDQEPARVAIQTSAVQAPPAANTLDGELRGVVAQFLNPSIDTGLIRACAWRNANSRAF